MESLLTLTILSVFLIPVCGYRLTCGDDSYDADNGGQQSIENFPWIGILYYPFGGKRLTTAVVLVTRQIVLGAANEIDKFPKFDFRKRSKVILGHNCSGPRIRVRDYTYHPDYAQNTYSSFAMIQLETDDYMETLRPICPPPTHFSNEYFFAMVLSNDCKNSSIRIMTMQYVSNEYCRNFYTSTGLDIETMWPTHTVCAKSVSAGQCIWRSGVILTVKIGRRWRLLGFGVYGPGCESPARFLDYGKYYKWVKDSVARVGRTSVTEIESNHIIMRRTFSNIQRYGLCDNEEKRKRLYDDTTEIDEMYGYATYNVTIYSNIEYSCVIFKADYLEFSNTIGSKPKLWLRRWCAGTTGFCNDRFQYMETHLMAVLEFQSKIVFSVQVFGKHVVPADLQKLVRQIHQKQKKPRIAAFREVKYKLVKQLTNHSVMPWYNNISG